MGRVRPRLLLLATVRPQEKNRSLWSRLASEIAASRLSPVLGRMQAGGGSGLHKLLGESATAHRKPDRHGAALAGFRVELNAASQGLRPPPHARDPGATRPSWRLLHWIQSLSVVFDGEPDLTLDKLQVGLDCRATGMA